MSLRTWHRATTRVRPSGNGGCVPRRGDGDALHLPAERLGRGTVSLFFDAKHASTFIDLVEYRSLKSGAAASAAKRKLS